LSPPFLAHEAERANELLAPRDSETVQPMGPTVGFATRLHPPCGNVAPARLLRLRMQQQLLYAPVGGLCHVDLVLRRAGERMGAGELLEVAS
jgi:hypothetical protein